MKKAGVVLITLGIFSIFVAFNIDIVIGEIYSIDLLNERQNIVYLSGVLFLAGIIIFGFGIVAKEESKNLKAFSLFTFLIPAFLLASIKIVYDKKADQSDNIKQASVEKKQGEIINFKNIPLDVPNIKQDLQKICLEDSVNSIDNSCEFKSSLILMFASYGIQQRALMWITIGKNDSLEKIEIHGSKSEILAQVDVIQSKYGLPVKKIIQVENGLGTKFDNEIFTWSDRNGNRIIIESLYKTIDEGRILIQSPSVVYLEKIQEQSLENFAKHNI
jgi:hypothetical protein